MRRHIHDAKKGQLFTLLAIFLVILLFASIEVYSVIRDNKIAQARVSSMDSFLQALEANLQRQTYTTSFRGFFLAIEEIEKTRNYIPDIDLFIEEAFFNGTVNGEGKSIMVDATFEDMIENMNDKAAKINANVSAENPQIMISQVDPWNVKVNVLFDFVMMDRQGLAEWVRKENITVYVPVEGFNDPIYSLNALGQYGFAPRKIKRTPYEGNFVSGADYTNLSDHFAQGYFSANTDAPSFLHRLEGDFTSDANGIETFVDEAGLAAVDATTYPGKSMIDHIYFDPANNTAGDSIAQVPGLRVDEGHKDDYQIP